MKINHNKKIIFTFSIVFLFFFQPIVFSFHAQASITTITHQSFSSDTLNDSTEYYALLVGISNYQSSILPYSINEINSFKETLLKDNNWNVTNIITLENYFANEDNIFLQINNTKNLMDENDIFVIYFVGHGGASDGKYYFLTANERVYDYELEQSLEGIDGRLILIFDFCRSGGFIKELKQRNRIVISSCKADEATYQVRNLSSGIFGYFFNLSLNTFSKTIEISFIYAYIASVIYSKRLSEEFGSDYVVHPQMYDGTLLLTPILSRNPLITNALAKIISSSIPNRTNEIWVMENN